MVAQPPVVKAYAYSQKTISGIREEIVNDDEGVKQRESPFPTTYFLYAEVKKGTKLSVTGVWIENKYYSSALKKVKTPVLLENESVPLKEKDTLLKRTSNDVFALTLNEEKKWESPNADIKKLTENNKAIFFLKYNNTLVNVPVKNIKELQPKAAM